MRKKQEVKGEVPTLTAVKRKQLDAKNAVTQKYHMERHIKCFRCNKNIVDILGFLC